MIFYKNLFIFIFYLNPINHIISLILFKKITIYFK